MKQIVYVTSNQYKKAENDVFKKVALINGQPVGQQLEFRIESMPVAELLEIRLEAMVQAEVVSAYHSVLVPCIVEHAGLIFEDFADQSYPGGLTKPMWNALGEGFVSETNSKGRRAIAKAVVAFCDGQSVRTFVGETHGRLAERPRGSVSFYWDTIFIPDCADTGNLTYAEIVDSATFGLEYKVKNLSQSSKAMMEFVKFFLHVSNSAFWEEPA